MKSLLFVFTVLIATPSVHAELAYVCNDAQGKEVTRLTLGKSNASNTAQDVLVSIDGKVPVAALSAGLGSVSFLITNDHKMEVTEMNVESAALESEWLEYTRSNLTQKASEAKKRLDDYNKFGSDNSKSAAQIKDLILHERNTENSKRIIVYCDNK